MAAWTGCASLTWPVDVALRGKDTQLPNLLLLTPRPHMGDSEGAAWGDTGLHVWVPWQWTGVMD